MKTQTFAPWYSVKLLDVRGYEIAGEDDISSRLNCTKRGNLKDAIARAKQYMTDGWAECSETTHANLGSEKVEIYLDGECVWDEYLTVAL